MSTIPFQVQIEIFVSNVEGLCKLKEDEEEGAFKFEIESPFQKFMKEQKAKQAQVDTKEL
jgi:hypothetical protein